MGALVREKVKGSGIWWVVICHKKKRKYVRVGSKDAAKAVARKVDERLASGALNMDAPEVPTFKDYAEKWYKGHVCTNLKASSQRGARTLLDKRLLPAFGGKPLDAITREDIRTFCAGAMETGRLKMKKAEDGTAVKTLARASVMGVAWTLSAIFNMAIEDGILSANPAQRPRRYIKAGDRKKEIQVLTLEEGKALLAAAKQHYARFYPLLAAALFTGMRQGELIALKWEDVDWHGKFIEVRRAVWEGHVSTPKNGKGRRVDMSDHLAAVLKSHRRVLAAEALEEGKTLNEWVFPSAERTLLDAANVRRSFSLSLKKAGLRQMRFHDLRHTFASWLIAAGESLPYVRDQLGHHSIGITVDTYGHLIPGANRGAVNRLAAAVENAPLARRDAEASPEGEDAEPCNVSAIKEI